MTLQEQAENIITDLGLLEKLAPFGEVHLVGNVAFGTTTKPDIDIQIYTTQHYEDAAVAIMSTLKEMGLANIIERRLKKSKKYLILGEISKEDTIWPIDITLTQPSKSYLKDSYHFYEDWAPKMTPEKLAAIRGFKEEFADQKIAGDNSAFYIYLGVLDQGIMHSPDMKHYLTEKKGKK